MCVKKNVRKSEHPLQDIWYDVTRSIWDSQTGSQTVEPNRFIPNNNNIKKNINK